MHEQENGWTFADAWVLTAVAVSPRPCSLTEMVSAADLLNHALLLDEEVTGALGKRRHNPITRCRAHLDYRYAGTDDETRAPAQPLTLNTSR